MSFLEELVDLLRGPLDVVPVVNAAVYSLGFSIFGVPAWKCAVVGITTLAASQIHYGRRALSRLGRLECAFGSSVTWSKPQINTG